MDYFIRRNFKYFPIGGIKKLLIPFIIFAYLAVSGDLLNSQGRENNFDFNRKENLMSFLGQQEFPPDSASELDTLNENLNPDITDTSEITIPDTLDNSGTLSNPDTLNTSGVLSDFDSLNTSGALTDSDTLNLIDTAAVLQEVDRNLSPYDSLWLKPMAQDSSARLKQFTHRRKPDRGYSFYQGHQSKFYTYPTKPYTQRYVELDSTGQYVLIKEMTPGGKEKVYMKLTLEQYMQYKLSAAKREEWRKIGGTYEYNEDKNDLEDLFSDITNIEIPLPSTSFLSIFGPPKISLDIDGAVDITGAWRSETTEGITTSSTGNTTSTPDFQQQVQINVRGTIGDKLTIAADWNTERTFEYENQVSIKYQGYEDEIIQSIEAGNVSLQTSSLVGGSEALFGIKALFQFGPFSLTALASQKKGEIEEVSVTGGAKKQEFEIRAYEYSKNHYFLDKIYADPTLDIFYKYFGSEEPTVYTEYQVQEIEVWKTSSGQIDKSKERRANAYIDLESIYSEGGSYDDMLRNTGGNAIAGQTVINGRFELMDESEYTLHKNTGFISFNSAVQDEEAIAVAYKIANLTASDNDDLQYGEFIQDANDSSQVMVLKLIKPADLKPGGNYEEAWNLQLKNIYAIGGLDINQEDFELYVKYEENTGDPQSDYEGTEYVTSFGLDITDESKTSSTPDGAFDFSSGRTIFTNTGEIIFPHLEPFGDDFPSGLPEDRKYDDIYDTSVTIAKQNNTADKFIITGQYSASISSTFNIGFNVVENSVEVYLSGNKLTLGSDYTVDYNIGQVTILNDAALVTGADLRITYEQNDLFQIASKTLVGLRGIYEFDKNNKLGFSFLNLSEKSLSDKVRIGEEPLNNSIFGMDTQNYFELPFLTKGLNHLISTSEMSSLTFNGEFAYMSPDPNTRKSTISSDNSESIAYIDDFEGSEETIPIGITWGGWKQPSPPTEIVGNEDLSASDLMDYKGKFYWFNNAAKVAVEDIWPERQTTRDDQTVTVLDLVYHPSEKGMYNWFPEIDESNPTTSWGGMMRALSSTANNLVDQNMEFIELWIQIPDIDEDDANLYIDLGQVSEDMLPNGEFDTEDSILENGLIDSGEDVGIDGMTDEEERAYTSSTEDDPSGDNFSYTTNSGDYSGINGLEGNSVSTEVGKTPDSEDLDGNVTLDRINNYFRYAVPLSTDPEKNPFIAGGGDQTDNPSDNWYQILIPLNDYEEEVGSPTFEQIETIRLFLTGLNENVNLRLAEFNLVGSQWVKVLDTDNGIDETDEVLTVGTVSLEDNPEYYSPPGVQRETQTTNTGEEVEQNEQALSLVIKDLRDGEKREVMRDLTSSTDIFNYKQLKMFIYGDEYAGRGSVSYFQDLENYGSDVYLQFGTDTSNYYEFRQPVQPGWNEIGLLFADLTAIKQARADDEVEDVYRVIEDSTTGASYAIKGSPSLTKIKFLKIGVENPRYAYDGSRPDNFGESVSGDIWINELRVIDAEDSPGWAYTFNTTLKLADLMKVSFNMSHTDPYFHTLSESFGDRSDTKNWGLNVTFDMLKLLPFNLQGSNFAVNYSRSESLARPLYLPGTDIDVEEAADQEREDYLEAGYSEAEAQAAADRLKFETETFSTSDTWTFSNIKFVLPSDHWWVKHTLNDLTFGFNYNLSKSRSPSYESKESWTWNASANYKLTFGKKNYIMMADLPVIGGLFGFLGDYKELKIHYSPQNFETYAKATRKRSYSLSRSEGAEPSIQRTFTTGRGFSFNWKITEDGFINLGMNYDVDIDGSLANLLTRQVGVDDDGTEILVDRSESEIWHDIFSGAMFGQDYALGQSFSLQTSPRLPSFWSLNKFFTLNGSYSVKYSWKNNLSSDIGRSAGWSNSISAGMTLRLKDLVKPLFGEEKKTSAKSNRSASTRNRGRGRDRNENEGPDNDLKRPPNNADSMRVAENQDVKEGTPSPFTHAFSLLKDLVRYAMFDYEQIRLTYSQSNSVSNSGLRGTGSGFGNFWGVSTDYSRGPSRMYMLGLSSDVGPRTQISGSSLTDNFSQKNSFDFSTSRDLWEGAQIDLKWEVGWGVNKSTTIKIDSLGNAYITNLTATESLDRSFLTLPKVVFLPFLDNGINKVASLYDANADNPTTNLSNAFVEGFESVPIFSKLPIMSDIVKYIPRPNWAINWTGLEKFSFLKKYVKRASLKHAYTSSYTEGWKVSSDGDKQIQTQKISYGFNPLIGVNLTFDKVFNGDMTGSIQYATTTNYSLGASTRYITEGFSRDISFSASYSKSGFSIPMFGLSLKNDLEISLSYSRAESSTVIYEMDDYDEDGTPQDGTIRTSIEPKLRYVMSQKVTMTLFYERTQVEPKGSSSITGTITNEAGLEVNITID